MSIAKLEYMAEYLPDETTNDVNAHPEVSQRIPPASPPISADLNLTLVAHREREWVKEHMELVLSL